MGSVDDELHPGFLKRKANICDGFSLIVEANKPQPWRETISIMKYGAKIQNRPNILISYDGISGSV